MIKIRVRTKAGLLWGLVGGLSFLVLVQAYHLIGGSFVGIPAMAGVAVLVGVFSAGSTYLLQPRVAGRNERT